MGGIMYASGIGDEGESMDLAESRLLGPGLDLDLDLFERAIRESTNLKWPMPSWYLYTETQWQLVQVVAHFPNGPVLPF